MSTDSKIWKSTADKLHAEKLAHKQTQKELKQAKLDYKVLVEERNALYDTLQEEQAEALKLYNEGALMYFDQDSFITSASIVEPYHNRTWVQDIDINVINTSAYQRSPYYKVVNGKAEIDKDKLDNYRRLLSL